MKYVVAKCAQLWFKKKTEKYKVTLTQQQQSNVCACANFIKTRGEGRGGEEFWEDHIVFRGNGGDISRHQQIIKGGPLEY